VPALPRPAAAGSSGIYMATSKPTATRSSSRSLVVSESDEAAVSFNFPLNVLNIVFPDV
jgi:hypothetical protein